MGLLKYLDLQWFASFRNDRPSRFEGCVITPTDTTEEGFDIDIVFFEEFWPKCNRALLLMGKRVSGERDQSISNHSTFLAAMLHILYSELLDEILNLKH